MTSARAGSAAAGHPADPGAPDPTELRAVVAALGPAGTPAGAVPAVPPRAARLLTAPALAWAAELATGLADDLLARHPGLTAAPAAVAEQIRALLLRVLLRLVDPDGVEDAPVMQAATGDSLRQWIATGVPFARVAESVRLSHGAVVRVLLDVAVARGTCAATLTHITLVVNRALDEALDDMARHYQRETLRFSTSAERARHELIDELVEGGPVDPRTVRDVLGLAIEDQHRGFVVSPAGRHRPGRPVEILRRALRVPALLVREQDGLWWVWATSAHPLRPDVDRLAAEIGDTARVGVGSGQPGAAGFRRTHLEAVAAHRLGPGVVDHGEHALAVLLSSDPERARWFVEAELGELAAPGPRNRELLTTLRCFFATRLRIASTAQRLHIHRNTAIQRLESIERILGHPVTERTAEVQAALALLTLADRALADRTLADADPGGGRDRP